MNNYKNIETTFLYSKLLKNKRSLIFNGCLLILASILISISLFYPPGTFSFIMLIGFLLSALALLIQSFIFFRFEILGFVLYFSMSILYVFIGVSLYFYFPYCFIIGFYLLLLAYSIMGIYRISISQRMIGHNWGWFFLNGFTNILLVGFMILSLLSAYLNLFFLFNPLDFVLIAVSTVDSLVTGITLFMLGVVSKI